MRRVIFATSALVLVLLIGGPQFAMATQGQAIVAGQDNTETIETRIYNTNVFTPANCGSAAGVWGALLACGHFGVTGKGAVYGVVGNASATGTAGVSGSGPTGVQGLSTNGSGVLGRSINGSGVFGEGASGLEGEGTENGVFAHGGTFGVFAEGTDYGTFSRGPSYGVFGQATTTTGIGVAAAASGNGRALSVDGKAQFSRSGRATITGSAATPKSSIVVNNVALTGKSLVLVTPQRNVAGTWVQAAVPNVANSRFTIFLNTTVTTNYPVAWMVIETP